MTILAVDDEPQIVGLIATILHKNGFDVLTADSAAHALSEFREHAEDIDLLITDVELPGLDGPSLAAQLQAKQPRLQVLLMSGYCEPELTHGFEFLSKPFTLDQMLGRVRSLLQPEARRLQPSDRLAKALSHVTAVAER
jgi:DNA-binding response OmpR family regulator